MSLDKVPQALISRSLKCDVSMTIDEKIERIATVVMSDNFMPSIDNKVKQDVIAFIRENANQFTDLNIRSAMNIAKIRYEMADEGWERMALYMAVA
jgi:parvulin-like peptidyl-prolyl isomerase